jgi:hypothetical protein
LIRSRVRSFLQRGLLVARLLSHLRLSCLITASIFSAQFCEAAETHWYKGNLHTHTLWSDGDDYPEMVVSWYKDQGYNFLALSDHNVLLEGTKWITVTNTPKKQLALQRYLEAFGTNWVFRRSMEGTQQVRLKTLTEFRPLFEEPERFILIPSEELSDKYKKIPIHLNVSNVRDLVKEQGGTNVLDVIQRSIDAVLRQQHEAGRPMMVHVNHPNFEYAIPAEILMQIKGDRFFEVYNGHAQVNNKGDKYHASVERVWDIILAFRMSELRLPAMFGLAVDDSHQYFDRGPTNHNPGRGWIVVRAPSLTPGALFDAMEKGDFYASTGVRLSDITRTSEEIAVKIESEPGVSYKTQFIGTRKNFDPASEAGPQPTNSLQAVTRQYSSDIGTVLAEVSGPAPSYKLKGDEIYVRAKVISSKKRSFPHPPDENEVAWVQPVAPKRE